MNNLNRMPDDDDEIIRMQGTIFNWIEPLKDLREKLGGTCSLFIADDGYFDFSINYADGYYRFVEFAGTGTRVVESKMHGDKRHTELMRYSIKPEYVGNEGYQE